MGEMVLVVLHHLILETPLEQMAGMVVPPVPPLGVIAVELMQRARQIRFGRRDRQVIVVRHLAIGMAPQRILLYDVREDAEESAPVPRSIRS